MEPFKMRFDYGAWKDIRRLRRGEAAVVEDIARAAKADLEVSLDPPSEFLEASSTLEGQPPESQGARDARNGEPEAGLQAWQKLVLKVRLRRQEVTAFGEAHGVHELLQRIKREGPDVSILDTGSLSLRSLYEQVIAWRLEEGGLLRGRLERALAHVHSLELRHTAATRRLDETRKEKERLEAQFKAEGDVRTRLRSQALAKDMHDLQAEATRVQAHCDKGRKAVQELAAQLEVLDADIERVGVELANLQPTMAADPEAPPTPATVHSPRTAYVILQKARHKDERDVLKSQLANERAVRRELEQQWGEVSQELEQRWKDVLHKFQGLQVENATLQAKLGEETQGRAELRARCEAMAVELMELRQHREGFGETLRVLREEKQEAMAEAERNGEKGAKLRQELEALRLEKEQADARLLELQQHKEGVGETLRVLRQERMEAMAEAERGREERAGLERQVDALQEDKGAVDQELEEQKDRLMRQQAAAERLLFEKAQLEAGLAEQARAAEEREAQLRRRIEELEKEGERLRAELEALRAEAERRGEEELGREKEVVSASTAKGRRRPPSIVTSPTVGDAVAEEQAEAVSSRAIMDDEPMVEPVVAVQELKASSPERTQLPQLTEDREGEASQAATGMGEAPVVMADPPAPAQRWESSSPEHRRLAALAAEREAEAEGLRQGLKEAEERRAAVEQELRHEQELRKAAMQHVEELKEARKAAREELDRRVEEKGRRMAREIAARAVKLDQEGLPTAVPISVARQEGEAGGGRHKPSMTTLIDAATAELLREQANAGSPRWAGQGRLSDADSVDGSRGKQADSELSTPSTGGRFVISGFDDILSPARMGPPKVQEAASAERGGDLAMDGIVSPTPRTAEQQREEAESWVDALLARQVSAPRQASIARANASRDNSSGDALNQSGEVTIDLSGGREAPSSARSGWSTLGTSASSGIGGSAFDSTATGSEIASPDGFGQSLGTSLLFEGGLFNGLVGEAQAGTQRELLATLDTLRQEEQRIEAELVNEEEAGRTLERRQSKLQQCVAEIIGEQARDNDLDRSAARDVVLDGVCRDVTAVAQELEASSRRKEELLAHHAAIVERRDTIEAVVEREQQADQSMFQAMAEALLGEGAAAQAGRRAWSPEQLSPIQGSDVEASPGGVELPPVQASDIEASPRGLQLSATLPSDVGGSPRSLDLSHVHASDLDESSGGSDASYSSEQMSPREVKVLRARIALLQDEMCHLREENARLVEENDDLCAEREQRVGDEHADTPPIPAAANEAPRSWSPVDMISPRGVVGEEGDMEAALLREEAARQSMRGEEARLLSRVTELEQQERLLRDTLSQGAEVLAGRQRVAAERQQLLNRMAQLHTRRAELEASALSALARVRQVQAELRAEAQRRREAEERLARSREEAAGLKRVAGEIETKLAEQQEQLAMLEAQRKGMELEVSKLDEENAELLERLVEGDRRQVELERQREASDGRGSGNKLTPKRRGLLDRASEVSAEKEVLQARLQAEEERRLGLEADLTEQLHAAVAENEALAEKIRVAEGGKLDVLSELMMLRQTVSDLSAEKVGLQTQLRAVQQAGEGGGRSRVKVEQLLEEKRGLKGRVRELETAKNALETQMIAVTYQLRGKLQQLEGEKRAKAELEERVATLSQGVRGEEGLHKQMQALSERCASLEAQRTQNEESLAKLSREKVELEQQLRQALASEAREEVGGARRKALVAKVKQLQDERDALEVRVKEVQEAQRAREGERSGLEEQLAAFGRRLAEAEEERALLQTHVVELEQEIEELRQATMEGREEAEAMRRYSDELEARERSRSEQAEQDEAWQQSALALAHERMERDKETLQTLLDSERATTQRQGREVEGLRGQMARLMEEKARLETMLRARGTAGQGAGGEDMVTTDDIALIERGRTDKAPGTEGRDRARTNNAVEDLQGTTGEGVKTLW